MRSEAALLHGRSNAYNIFILILTIFSVVIMAVLFLPLNQATIDLLRFYDNLICAFFLLDFFITYRAAANKKDYFFKERGWLDLVGSIPSFEVILPYKLLGLVRLARLNRARRIV